MSIGIIELLVIALCGLGALAAVGAIVVYFLQRDRQK